jgi:hypothetical protein
MVMGASSGPSAGPLGSIARRGGSSRISTSASERIAATTSLRRRWLRYVRILGVSPSSVSLARNRLRCSSKNLETSSSLTGPSASISCSSTASESTPRLSASASMSISSIISETARERTSKRSPALLDVTSRSKS